MWNRCYNIRKSICILNFLKPVTHYLYWKQKKKFPFKGKYNVFHLSANIILTTMPLSIILNIIFKKTLNIDKIPIA